LVDSQRATLKYFFVISGIFAGYESTHRRQGGD